ncbi:membrane protein DedA with SNARE-associated domain/rhodanese-related sulfurtransferase [Paraburkholderia atlantica]|uniref:VTT domain-containing protein n=1 Tax=Paraburkholderia atlantica TaxID=2654982 RepID=UPI0015908FC3|nr:VTT domain-containing protein [Paraburkholderia atlantica]MBB5418164.1 membrane protein DedA with SNARE-associated domain/rhodanese-related sulfurtransferase [Paraburkholderia atlantica]NUY34071.1 cytochrome P460 [Paraburkholderia atlantica]
MVEFPLSAVSTWGSAIVFVNVLLTRLGVPIPAVPMLLFAGSAIAAGTLSFWPTLGAAVLGALIGDATWFTAGRLYGRKLLAWLGRLSPVVDTRLEMARSLFERYGMPLVSISKFVPGLGLITPPLMGTTAVDVRIYALWDLASVTTWAAFWLLGGAAVEREVHMLRAFVERRGGTFADIILVVALVYLLYRLYLRYYERRRFTRAASAPATPMLAAPTHASPTSDPSRMPWSWRHSGRLSRIAPSRVLDARPGAPLLDLRRQVPDALALDPHSPELIDGALRTHDVVIYCICPDSATALEVSQHMRRNGYTRIRALRGGLDAWQRRGFPVGSLAYADGPAADRPRSTWRDETPAAVTLRGFAPRGVERA